MRKTFIGCAAVLVLSGLASCASHYALKSVDRTRIVVDRRYDAVKDEAAMNFVKPYSKEIDAKMRPVVGRIARYMAVDKPESELSNLLADILIWAGARYHEQPDFAVYNMGGIRAALSEGDVTLGDVLDVSPFENKVCYLTLTGVKVKELFAQMARRGGEGVSHGVELLISRDGKLLSSKLDGKPIEDGRRYRVATLDYLSQGNDGLVAFKSATEMNVPTEKKDNVRELIADYFREKAGQGVTVDSKKEGRITVE